ncbi:MFS transporter [Paenibacillus zanthoxyli]|uniref:MFS transporter n=1 Tax=Paenibacillus zanthoxyli TaxID=369399 RepID=UPI000472DE03|nr:MFS transporter [Paenibacillus zanthoxyli]
MFSNRYVRTLVLSQVTLQLGIWIRNFAVLLFVTEMTGNDPFYVSLISVMEYGPIFLFAIIGGTFADRWQPKRTMVWSDLLSAISVAVVLAATLRGQWAALLLGMLVSASLSQFSQPSAMKLYKKHVPDELLQKVMAMSQSLIAIFMIAGPIIGTFIYARLGIGASLLITMVCFFGSALILSLLPRDAKEMKSAETGSFLEDVAEGIRYLWRNRVLRTLGFTFAVTGLAAGMIQPMLIFVAIEKLGQDKSFLQWLLMANGAAMLVGGAVIMGIAKKVKPQILLTVGLLVSAACNFGVGSSTFIPATLGLQIIGGFVYPCIQVGIQTLILKNTESSLLGRVGGAITPIFMGMMLIGMMLSGYVKDTLSLFTVYAASGGLLIIGALLLAPLLKKEKVKAEIGITH